LGALRVNTRELSAACPAPGLPPLRCLAHPHSTCCQQPAEPPPPPQALEKYNIEKEIAAHIKKSFDSKYGPTWHCIVGRNFGASPQPTSAERRRRPAWLPARAHSRLR